jgi:hypothetical protein
LCNSNGAIGFYSIDTTQLANGVHTISWSVTDNAGHSDGVGSRYFTVANTGGGNAPVGEDPIEPASDISVTLRQNHAEPRTLGASTDRSYTAEVEELGLIELHLGAVAGQMLVDGRNAPLPVGSTLKGGVFYWHAALGFLGEYRLAFERPDGSRIRVRLNVRPKSYLSSPY